MACLYLNRHVNPRAPATRLADIFCFVNFCLLILSELEVPTVSHMTLTLVNTIGDFIRVLFRAVAAKHHYR